MRDTFILEMGKRGQEIGGFVIPAECNRGHLIYSYHCSDIERNREATFSDLYRGVLLFPYVLSQGHGCPLPSCVQRE
jgi:hypothetical protein